MFLAFDHLIAPGSALAHLEERPYVGRWIGPVEDDRVEAAQAEAERGKLGPRFGGEVAPVGPVVITNRWKRPKQDLVADQTGGRSRGRRRGFIRIGLTGGDTIEGDEDLEEGRVIQPVTALVELFGHSEDAILRFDVVADAVRAVCPTVRVSMGEPVALHPVRSPNRLGILDLHAAESRRRIVLMNVVRLILPRRGRTTTWSSR